MATGVFAARYDACSTVVMQDDDLERLRRAYAEALQKYEEVAATLNRHILAQTEQNIEEMRREREARAQLDRARRLYLDALLG
jgi:hypothetical protein